MKTRTESTLNAWTRALVILITLLAVCYLAIYGDAQIAPLAAGALISALVAAITYEFRGRIESSEPPSADQDVVTNLSPPKAAVTRSVTYPPASHPPTTTGGGIVS